MRKHLFRYMLAAAALVLPLALSAAAPHQRGKGKMRPHVKKELCLQLYSVRDLVNNINPDGKASEAWTSLLSRLHGMGYTSVEAANYDHDKGTFYGRKAKDYKADIEKAGMTSLSSHVGHNMSSEEVASGDFSASLKWWKKTIADHKAAGVSYLVDPAIGLPKTLRELDLYCQYLNAVGKMCKAEGIAFGYHNHNYEFKKVDDKVMYDYMLEHTDPQYVFFQMDMYWTVFAGCSPVDYFNRYPGRFRMFHCKDHKEIGQSGMVGWDAIFRNAKTAGLEYAVAEIEQYSVPVEQSVEQSARYLLRQPFYKASYVNK